MAKSKKHETEKKRFLAYVRVSSDTQTENTSLDEQERMIREYCKLHKIECVEIYREEGRSAKDTKNRPEYNKMIAFAKNKKNNIDGIIVFKMDRIHRSLKELLIFVEDDIVPNGLSFISISDHVDTSSSNGEMFFHIMGTVSQFERRQINSRTKMGRLATAKSNSYAGGRLSYGYMLENDKIIKHPEESEIVKKIFELYIEGKTCYWIAKHLNKSEIKTREQIKYEQLTEEERKEKKKPKGWFESHIIAIVKNETYTGKNVYSGPIEQNNIKQTGVYPRIISTQLWGEALKRSEIKKTGDFTKKGKMVVAYLRFSGSKEELSIEEQLDMILSYCKENNYRLEAHFKDIGSADELERKGYADMFRYLSDKKNKIKGIIVTDVARIHEDSMNLVEMVEEQFQSLNEQLGYQLDFKSVKEPFDIHTEEGINTLKILGINAQKAFRDSKKAKRDKII